jgi:predicted HAD superfamily Cof-like phosphohydrolase
VNPITKCLSFFIKAVPEPTSKNFNTQLGCHFEEVHEMMLELSCRTPQAQIVLTRAMEDMHELAEWAKRGIDYDVDVDHRIGFLDAVCDQMVTAIGCAHMLDMNIEDAFNETNRSNLSKFGEDGQPIFNENMKVMKGPNYRQSDLSAFV